MPENDAKRARRVMNAPLNKLSNASGRIGSPPPKPATDNTQDTLRSGLNKAFLDDKTVRQAFATNLKERGIISRDFAERSRKVFANFRPTAPVSAKRPHPNFVKPGDNLLDVQQTNMAKGIELIKRNAPKHSARFAASEELNKMVKKSRRIEPGDKPVQWMGTISGADIYARLKELNKGPEIFATNTLVTSCEAEQEANRRMQQITSQGNTSTGASGSTSTSSQADTAGAPLYPDAAHITPTKMVKENVYLQMHTATSPESTLSYDNIPEHSNQMKDSHDKPTFELRAGPTDVTAYHDFHSLQIAFENVWEEMFDAQLASLGQQLYQEYVKLKDFSGMDDSSDPMVSTVDELRELMAEVKSFTQQTVQNLAPVFDAGSSDGKGTGGYGANTGSAPNSFEQTAAQVALGFATGGISPLLKLFGL
ncbi:MAG: hypothetical protein LAO31_19365 [Acidobacteriia bacterium]|nr:hypothetical protein [Terriglobia bacterium]